MKLASKHRTAKPERWTNFLSEVKNESQTFLLEANSALTQKNLADQNFEACYQRTFSALHAVPHKIPDPSKAVPRLARPLRKSTTNLAKEKKSKWQPLDFEIHHFSPMKWAPTSLSKSAQRFVLPSLAKSLE